MRIVILGCAGSGKTALAHRLGRETKLRIVTLDNIWNSKVTERDLPAFRALVAHAHEGDYWVSDGNFALATFDIRLPQADLIVWLERPRVLCAWRVIRRAFSSAVEHHDVRHLPEVLAYIWSFEKLNRPLIESARLAHGPHVPVVQLTDENDVSYFVRNLRHQSSN